MISLIATMKIKEGKKDDVLKLFGDLVPKVREEKGTAGYIVCQNGAVPNSLTIVERYTDKDALQAHASSGYFKEFSRAVAPLLEGRAEITLLEELIAL